MKFYEFDQNNSGGYFVHAPDVGLGQRVAFEADSEEAAWAKLEAILDRKYSYTKYCTCCGERWSDWNATEYDSASEIDFSFFGPTPCYIHYADGRIEEVLKP